MSRQLLILLAGALLLLGCPSDDDDSAIDDDDVQDDDDSAIDDDDDVDDDDALPTRSVAGVLRQESGLPLADATLTAVELASDDEGPSTTSDADGRFVLDGIGFEQFGLRLSATDRWTVVVTGFAGDEEVSLTLPEGDGEAVVPLPAAPDLVAVASEADVELSWNPSDQGDFARFVVVSSDQPGVSVLHTHVGDLRAFDATSMTDRNMTAGSWTYRVFHELDTDAGRVARGSDEVTVEIAAADAFPDRLAFRILKTIPLGGPDFQNQARWVVTTTSISDNIGSGMSNEVTSPLLDDPTSLTYLSPMLTAYEGVEHYFHGDPAVYVGETRKLDEWDAKYAAALDDFEDDAVIGTTSISIDGESMSFPERTEGLSANRLYGVELNRDGDGRLEISWSMMQDGAPFDGGAGAYGWRYLAKVGRVGPWGAEGDGFEWEVFWSNWCLNDVGRDIGFNRVVDLAGNMPQDEASILVPDDVFDTGDTVSILLYAISTTDSTSSPDSGVDGYGMADMYWLFAYRTATTVP